MRKALRTLVLILSFCSLSHAQTQNRVIEVYTNFTSPEITALQIVSVTVDGRPVALNVPFAADPTWLKTLTFRVRNISGRTLNSLHIGLGFDFAQFNEKAPRDVAFSLIRGIHGNGHNSRDASDRRKPILPGEEIDLSLTEKQLSLIQDMAERSGMTELKRVKLMPIAFINFADGSGVKSGISY